MWMREVVRCRLLSESHIVGGGFRTKVTPSHAVTYPLASGMMTRILRYFRPWARGCQLPRRDDASSQGSFNQSGQSDTATISWQQEQPSVLQQVRPALSYERSDDVAVRVLAISATDPLSHPKNVELARDGIKASGLHSAEAGRPVGDNAPPSKSARTPFCFPRSFWRGPLAWHTFSRPMSIGGLAGLGHDELGCSC